MLEAADGLEALQRLAGRPVDLVVADAVERAPEPGVTVMLEKPFDRRQLRRGVRRALAVADQIR